MDWDGIQMGVSSSSLFDFLRSNSIPTAYESNQISNVILQGEFDLTRLDVEIKRARAACDKLETRRRELRRMVDAYKSVLAPIRRLPPEILGEIFLLCAADDISRRPDASLAPLLLCRICSVWRNVALRHWALWKRINVSLDSNHAGRQKMMKLWLDRAQSLPLDIVIKADEDSRLGLLVATLLPYFSSTQKLALCMPFAFIQFILAMDVSFSSMALLESLHLSFDFDPVDDLELSPDAPLIINAPRLHSLKITCPESCVLRIEYLQMKFPQIVNLTLDNVFFPDNAAATLFKQLMNLEHLTLNSLIWDDDEVLDSSFPIILPKLRVLDITTDLPEEMSRLFQMVTLPLLERLCTSHSEEQEYLDFTELSRLQTRSSYKLSELSLKHVQFSTENFEEFTRANPSLVALEIYHSYSITSMILRFLIYHPENTNPILPMLKNLSITDLWEFLLDDVELVKMIKSRWWPDSESRPKFESRISRLETVHIQTEEGEPFFPALLEDLYKLREEGLKLTVIALPKEKHPPTV